MGVTSTGSPPRARTPATRVSRFARYVGSSVDEVLYKACLVAGSQDDHADAAVGVGGVLGEAAQLVDDGFCLWPVGEFVTASFAVPFGYVDD
jgi:hypothetical protein